MGAFGDPVSHSLELINAKRHIRLTSIDISLLVDVATFYCEEYYKKVLRMALYILTFLCLFDLE